MERELIQRAAEDIFRSKKTIAFTGAGIPAGSSGFTLASVRHYSISIRDIAILDLG